jgi:hypothetical protein
MITTEIHEPSKHNGYHKSVYYRNQRGRIIRRALIDDHNRIVKDYLYEHNADQLVECIVLYAQDHTTVTAIKKYDYYEGSSNIKSTVEYKYQDGREILTQRAEHVYNDTDRTERVTVFGSSDEPVGYELYGYRKGDDFMSLLGCFNMRDEKISCFDFKVERLF